MHPMPTESLYKNEKMYTHSKLTMLIAACLILICYWSFSLWPQLGLTFIFIKLIYFTCAPCYVFFPGYVDFWWSLKKSRTGVDLYPYLIICGYTGTMGYACRDQSYITNIMHKAQLSCLTGSLWLALSGWIYVWGEVNSSVMREGVCMLTAEATYYKSFYPYVKNLSSLAWGWP